MAERALSGKTRNIGGEKGERVFGVLAVFGEIEMHAPDMAPPAVARGQKSVQIETAGGLFGVKRFGKLAPQPSQRVGVEIFAAAHRRRLLGDLREFVRIWLRRRRRRRPGSEPR